MGTTVEFTLGDFFDAIEKNGLHQSRYAYFGHYDGNEVVAWTNSPTDHKLEGPLNAACAIGQAAINIGTNPVDLHWSDPYLGLLIPKRPAMHALIGDVVSLNDVEGKSFTEIAATMREKYGSYLSHKITGRKVDYKIETSSEIGLQP